MASPANLSDKVSRGKFSEADDLGCKRLEPAFEIWPDLLRFRQIAYQAVANSLSGEPPPSEVGKDARWVVCSSAPFKTVLLLQPVSSQTERQHGRAVPGEITEPRPCLPASSTAQFGVLSGCACTKWQNPFDDVASRICRCGQFFFKSRLTRRDDVQVRTAACPSAPLKTVLLLQPLRSPTERQHSRAGRAEKKAPRPCLPVTSTAEFRVLSRFSAIQV